MTPRAIAEAMATFPGLPHRMENLGQIGGVRFVNDSKATNADSAAQALAVFPRAHWIAGGVAKAGGIASLASFFPALSGAYLFGEAADGFSATLTGRTRVERCDDLAGAVRAAFAAARQSGEPDPVVLFSPACASFDQFRDYEHRGAVFKQIVATLDVAPVDRATA